MLPTSRIHALVQAKLAGRKIDPAGFVDALLAIVTETGEIRCHLASEQTLRFEMRGAVCEVELDGCRAKLRMLCTRVSVLCNETGGAPVSPYGGEGPVRVPSQAGAEPNSCTARFKNTPDEHEFTISPTVRNPR